MNTRCVLLLTALLTCIAARANAQAGVRAGVSGSPNQFYAGIHFESDPLVDQLRFRPNLEIGVGDDQTLLAFNFEFAYKLPLKRTMWSAYVGGGPALVIDRLTNNTNTGGGFNILIGLEHRRGLFTELKVGAIDSPNVKFGVGYTFR